MQIPDAEPASAGGPRLDRNRAASDITGAARGETSPCNRAASIPADVPHETIRGYIELRLSHKILISDLARVVDLSSYYLRVWFQDHFGATPHAYIRERRVERAKFLMLQTNLPLCEIALQCGSTDQAHFTKQFIHIVGEPPGRWRRRLRRPAL